MKKICCVMMMCFVFSGCMTTSEEDECTKDSECLSGEICVEGVCEVSADSSSVVQSPDNSAYPDKRIDEQDEQPDSESDQTGSEQGSDALELEQVDETSDIDSAGEIPEGGICVPGTVELCPYGANEASIGVGECRQAEHTCNDEGKWGECSGEVLPVMEPCEPNDKDDDCDGTVDNVNRDFDGDGVGRCEGDCCERQVDCQGVDPAKVNPYAIEIADNNVDDNCNGEIDENLQTCEKGIAEDSKDAMDYARAMGLCSNVISAAFHEADGQGEPEKVGYSLFSASGDFTKPLQGSLMASIATFNEMLFPKSSMPPEDWFSFHNNEFPNAPGCPSPLSNKANDSVMLKLVVKVPSNAKSFNFNTYFYSEEYPVFLCTEYNDMFLVLLTSRFNEENPESTKKNPEDGNLAIFFNGEEEYPVGVNLSSPSIPLNKDGYGLFKHCEDTNEYSGCMEDDGEGNSGLDYLAGTEFENHGGTGWLKTYGNVVPGEEITLRFVIWNTGDHALQSRVLIDNFKWELDTSVPGTGER